MSAPTTPTPPAHPHQPASHLPPLAPGLQSAAQPPGRGLGYAVMAVAVVITVLQLLTAVLAGPAADRYLAAVQAGGSALDVFTPYDGVVSAIFPVQLVALVLTGIWLLRLRRFSERVQPTLQHARSRWWAFGGWLVPIVSFWFPFQYVRDVRDGLRPFGFAHGTLVGWWWTAFLVAQFGDGVSGPFGDGTDDASLRLLPAFEWFQAAVCTVALVLWLIVVRRLQRSVDEVPAEVLQRTAYARDPDAYDHQQAPVTAPLYGPGTAPPAATPPPAPPYGSPSGGPPQPPPPGAGAG